jgi:hypothetical protein
MVMNDGSGQKNKIRFDGVYQSSSENKIRKFFRFYSDGTVIEATTEAEVNELRRWFRKEKFIHDYHSIGTYEVKGEKIYFSTKASGYGVVVYEVTLSSESEINLKSKSLINGNESEYTANFIMIADWE